LVETLDLILQEHGNMDVLYIDEDTCETVGVERVDYLVPFEYHAAVLDIDKPTVVLLPYASWDDEDEEPD
jgi:hypothetical protein